MPVFEWRDRFHSQLKRCHPTALIGLVLSLSIPLYFGLLTLHYGLHQDYIVQDDARQHVVWFQRLVDPGLFAHDPIADYYQTVAPAGYKFLYGKMAELGVSPLRFAKLLPIGLSLIASFYLFECVQLIFPVPLGGFLAVLLFNQQLWLDDDLVSATARSFVYPLFSAFLYYLCRRSIIPCLISIALQGLWFPPMMFVSVAMLTVRLVQWQGGSLRLSQERKDYLLWGAGGLVALLVIVPFAVTLSNYGPAITAAQMQAMPEYGWGGRSEYFGVNPVRFILSGGSGLRIPLFPSIVWVGFALPWLLRSRSPLIRLITPEIKLLAHLLLGSLGMFLLAHLLLLRLHFPSRYMYHSWRFGLSIAASMVLTVWLQRGWQWMQQKRRAHIPFSLRERLLIGLTAVGMAIVIIVPAVPHLFLRFQGWIVGDAPSIYQYLAAQPSDTLVASLSPEADSLPAFAQRSTLVGREFAIAHHPAYYQMIRQRIIDLMQAQYSSQASDIHQFIKKYQIDFFLIDRAAFDPAYLLGQDWLIHSSFQDQVQTVVSQLQQGQSPALGQFVDRCAIASTETLMLIAADCILNAQEEDLLISSDLYGRYSCGRLRLSCRPPAAKRETPQPELRRIKRI